MKPQNDWKKYLGKEYRWLCGSKQRQAVTATNCRLKSASIGIIFREKKAQAQVENEKQCKAIRKHSADKKANKTDDKAIKLLSEISSFTTVPRMKLFVVKISLPLTWTPPPKKKDFRGRGLLIQFR